MFQRQVFCTLRAVQVASKARARPLSTTGRIATLSPRSWPRQPVRWASSERGDSQVPPTQQPPTSPDRQQDALSDPQASDATSGASRDAATVSQKDDEASQERFGTEEHTLMSEQEKEILAKLLKEFPGGEVAVQDVSGGCGTFFAISVESNRFKDMSRIKQHQLVNKVLSEEVKTWHGMQALS